MLAVQAIPYRTEAAVSGGSFAGALLTVAIVLGLLAVAAFQARRRGWLAGLGVPAKPGPAGAPDGIAVRASRRVSPATSVHVIAYQGQEYLIVESARGASTSFAPLPVARPKPEDAPR